MAPPRSYPVAIPYPPCLKAISATRPPAMSGVIMPSPLMPTRSAKLESSSFLVADSPVMLSPSDPDASSPSLYATFKILQLVRSVAKRVNRRARIAPPLTKRRPVRARQDSCQDFELEAYEKIDRYLGRCGNKRAKPLTKTVVTDRPEPLPSEGIQWILSQIERSGTDSYSLDAVAKSDKLFLQRDTEFDLKPLCLGELTQRVIIIRDLLDSLKPKNRHDRVRTLCEANEILDADETYLANLQHLLLCLYHQLLGLLIEQVVELAYRHLFECQKDQDKHGADWFFVFPDARHPLSTTWPWSIRPSLAVIWGVCWMFYDFANITLDTQGNVLDAAGNVIASSELHGQVQQYLLGVRARDESFPAGGGLDDFHDVWGAEGARAMDAANLRHFINMDMPSRYPHQGYPTNRTPTPLSYNTTRTAPPLTTHFVFIDDWLPADPFAAQAPSYSTTPADGGTWPPAPGRSEWDNHSPLQPSSIRIPHTSQPQDPPSIQSDNLCDSVYPQTYYPLLSNNHLGPPHSPPPPLMTPEISCDMSTPVSSVNTHHSPQNHTTDEHDIILSQLVNEMTAVNRKRTHSEMSSNGAPQLQQTGQPYHRGASVMSGPQEDTSPPQEQDSPRVSRSFQRGEPLRNTDGKFYCNSSNDDCSALSFDRKCEWSKHMDKHDRPYRCQHASCAKLQGFTYSGGLLRHEREVHGKHGGPKAQLMCPMEDCKRHSGKGFTRKENLNEHIRRVHETKSQGLPSQTPTVSRRETMDATQGAVDEAVETPASDMVGPDELIESLAFGDGKGSVVENAHEVPMSDVDALQHQIKRLRAENTAKDERLRMLEQSQMEKQQEVDRLNASLLQFQQSRAAQPPTWSALDEQAGG